MNNPTYLYAANSVYFDCLNLYQIITHLFVIGDLTVFVILAVEYYSNLLCKKIVFVVKKMAATPMTVYISDVMWIFCVFFHVACTLGGKDVLVCV